MTDPLQTLAAADQALAHATTELEHAERRKTERRIGRPPGGRRAVDQPVNAWSTGQMAYFIGMSSGFVVSEIKAGELRASIFGGEYRIAIVEVRRYLKEKNFPLPQWMAA